MKKIISTILISILFLASCSEYDDTYYYDMFLAIEVVDSQGNDLLGDSSTLIKKDETKIVIGGKDYYLNSPESNAYTFRHIKDKSLSYLKIGHWCGDRSDFKITLDWGGHAKKDLIIFSYDSHLNGFESSSHDFRYPYNITINGKELTFNNETGRFIYVKDID